MKNELIFIIGICALSALQYFGCWGYLHLSKKIEEPLSFRGQTLMYTLWIMMSVAICTIAIAGVKLVIFSEVSLNRAVGVAPMLIGSILSYFVFKAEWKEFHQRFQKKK